MMNVYDLPRDIVTFAGNQFLDRLFLSALRNLRLNVNSVQGSLLGTLIPRLRRQIRMAVEATRFSVRLSRAWSRLVTFAPNFATRFIHIWRKVGRSARRFSQVVKHLKALLMARFPRLGGIAVQPTNVLLLWFLPRHLRWSLRKIIEDQPWLRPSLERNPSLLLRAHYLQRILGDYQPGIIVSFLTQTNLACIIATYKSHIPVLVSERNDVVRQPMSPHVMQLRAGLYRSAAIITSNTQYSSNTLTQWFPGSNVRFLPNNFPEAIVDRVPGAKKIGVVCRLEPQKNVALTIRGFWLSALPSQGWILEIWGEGPERENLADLISALKAEKSIALKGATGQPLDVMRELDLLVAASDYEGSSNTIHEAVSQGVIPLFSESIEEMRDILPPGLFGNLSFSRDTKSLSRSLGQVAVRILPDRRAVQQIQRHFETYWALSRMARSDFLRVIDDTLENIAHRPTKTAPAVSGDRVLNQPNSLITSERRKARRS